MSSLKVSTLALLVGALALVAVADEKSRGRGGVEIKVGQERRVGGAGLRISFERVEEDSRCPAGVACVWAGNARARFSATSRGGERVEFDLNTGVEPAEYRFGGYTIRLAKLAPHPRAGRELNKSDYVATVVVSKTKK